MKKQIIIMIVIAVVVIGGGILLFAKGNPQSQTPGAPVDNKSLLRENSHMTGSKDAKVTIVEFGDYQCPACAAAEPAVEALMQKYKDKSVNFAFRNFPLSQHQNAQITSEAAEAAGAQGKFWEMHNKLYATQSDWAESAKPMDMLLTYAQELNLDIDKFKSEVEQNKYRDVIQSDANDGISLGINATPTFFINGEKIVGVPDKTFAEKIDALLTK